MPVPERQASSMPLVQIQVPKKMEIPGLALSSPMPLQVEDLQLTWLDFFKKHNPSLYGQVVSNERLNEMRLADNRGKNERKIWSLTDMLKDFVDSFENNRKMYNGRLIFRKNMTEPEPVSEPVRRIQRKAPPPPMWLRPAATTTAPQPDLLQPGPSCSRNPAPPTGLSSPERDTTQTLAGQKRDQAPTDPFIDSLIRIPARPPPRQPSCFPNLNIPVTADKANSMVGSVVAATWDSQSDLLEIGMSDAERKELGRQITQNVKEVDNRTWLSIKDELQTTMNKGRWFGLTQRDGIPTTMNFLQMLLGIAKETDENQNVVDNQN